MQEAFNHFDADGDGHIDRVELMRVCNLSPGLAKMLIRDVDTDNDGKISFDEWMEALTGVGSSLGGNVDALDLNSVNAADADPDSDGEGQA